MKYKLETIPVIDAIKEDSECPLCLLEEKAEKYYVQFYIGPSVMVPEIRVEVNKTGFCPEHHHKLLHAGEAQNIGLVTHTWMADYHKGQMPLVKAVQSVTDSVTGKIVSPGKVKQALKAVDAWMVYLKSRTDSCMICHKLEETLKRYLFTIIYNWDKDPEFRQLLLASRGVCHLHLNPLLNMAREVLSGSRLLCCLNDLTRLQTAQYERLDKELEWFTQKFKHENFAKPWGNSADAHKRTVRKISGRDRGITESR